LKALSAYFYHLPYSIKVIIFQFFDFLTPPTLLYFALADTLLHLVFKKNLQHSMVMLVNYFTLSAAQLQCFRHPPSQQRPHITYIWIIDVCSNKSNILMENSVWPFPTILIVTGDNIELSNPSNRLLQHYLNISN
jgi:hypothetical protein